VIVAKPGQRPLSSVQQNFPGNIASHPAAQA